MAWTIATAGGWGRAVLLAATTAASTALILVAISLIRLYTTDDTTRFGTQPLDAGGERLFEVMADPGTRGGAVFGVLLLVVPLVLLLDQAVRLGSSSRQRRLSALAIAGATRGDLRRWAALEVGVPAAVGAVLGVPTWWLMRQVLGHGLVEHTGALVPTTMGPGVWALPVIVVVAAYGVVVGLRSGSRAEASLHGTRGMHPPPRVWPALLSLAVAYVLLTSPLLGSDSWIGSDVAYFGALALLVAGLASLAPWAAYHSASVVARRAQSAAWLLAARRLMADARPAGRAAAAVGAVGLAGGAIGSVVGGVLATNSSNAAYYLVPIALIAVCTLVAVLLVAGSLAVHSTEVLLERRRELASLVATGVPVGVISDSQRAECLIATMPLTVAGAIIGCLGYAGLGAGGSLAFPLASTLVTVAVTAGACWVVTWGLRPWVRDAARPEHLRTT